MHHSAIICNFLDNLLDTEITDFKDSKTKRPPLWVVFLTRILSAYY